MRPPAAEHAAAGTGAAPNDPPAPSPGRILIVSDAWHPQVNGVVQTLDHLGRELSAAGISVEFLTPDGFRTFPMPTYPAIRLALATPCAVATRIERFAPDHVHVATEGPLGLLAVRHCLARGRVFTTSYHTRFPEYVQARLKLPTALLYAALRRFHNSGSGTLVATRSLAGELAGRGFRNLRLWSRGVDTDFFRPDRRRDMGLPRPVFLYVGRVAVEKNLPAFLDLDLPGSKVIVGDGPALAELQARYPATVFLGERSGEELASLYASGDVFVFPSLTDTFGIVQLEALASGLPVAAFPVTGPADIFADGIGGALSDDLKTAALSALRIDRTVARGKAMRFGWAACAAQFLEHVRSARTLGPGSLAEPGPAVV